MAGMLKKVIVGCSAFVFQERVGNRTNQTECETGSICFTPIATGSPVKGSGRAVLVLQEFLPKLIPTGFTGQRQLQVWSSMSASAVSELSCSCDPLRAPRSKKRTVPGAHPCSFQTRLQNLLILETGLVNNLPVFVSTQDWNAAGVCPSTEMFLIPLPQFPIASANV